MARRPQLEGRQPPELCMTCSEPGSAGAGPLHPTSPQLTGRDWACWVGCWPCVCSGPGLFGVPQRWGDQPKWS